MGIGCDNTPFASCFDSTSPGSSFVLRGPSAAANADLSDFSGDFSAISSGSNINVFLRQTVGAVERKIVIIVPSLGGNYDLSTVYLSYTETEGATKRVWKAASGTLSFDQCDPGVVLHVNGDMEVLTAETNSAAGSFILIGVAKSP